jgi:hypothetical protein
MKSLLGIVDLLLFRPFMYGNAPGQSDQPGLSKLVHQFAFWHVSAAAKQLVKDSSSYSRRLSM